MTLKDSAWRIVNSRHMLWGVGIVSFLESIIIPVPLEAVLTPAMQINRQRIWQLAVAALVGCMVGAMAGYAVGYFLFEAFGQTLVDWLSSEEEYEQIKQQMSSQGFWFVLSVGIVPVPFQIAMLAAGATAYSLPLFIVATSIARAFRYFGLAWLVWKFGDSAEKMFRDHKLGASLVLAAVVLLIWWLTSSLAD